ncbi:MAG: tRNA dihydrouridine synthase DusB [Deltaproteobacteria bacterium]|nr:tRNA dihydrouridine synthase DusB [Deltaproteobacteria bacterium]
MTDNTRYSIGRFNFGKGASLAPMAGVTNPPFRQLCSELGALYSVTELISCHAIIYFETKPKNRTKKRGEKTLALMDHYKGESPHVVQIYGREPDLMAEAAKIVEREGADIIDLNFGCPARKVIKNGNGSGVALMLDPPLLEEITRSVVNAVEIPVTAKTRLGYSKDAKNGVEIAQRLEASGVELITIHARTREQGHGGDTDFETLKNIVDAVKIPVIGNGGIKSYEDAENMIEQTGCRGVAIGQGAKGNPWIFREVAGGMGRPDIRDRVKTCRRHLQFFSDWSGEELAVLEMRKHAAWYLKGFDGAAAFRNRLGEATSLERFNNLLDEVDLILDKLNV